MANRMDNRWEDRISQIVEDAVNNMDFQLLEQNIRDTIDTVFDEWKIGPGTNRKYPSYHSARQPYQDIRRVVRQRTTHYASQRQGQQTGTQTSQAPRLFPRSLPGSISSVMSMVFGGIGTAIFGLSALGCALIVGETAGAGVGLGIMSVFTAASLGLIANGVIKRQRIRRFHTYCSVLGKRTYCDVKELAAGVSKPVSFVVKDLRKMIQKKFFLHGHMDQNNTCLMLDEESYQQYLDLQLNYQKQQQEAKAQKEIFSSKGIENPELIKALEEGNAYIKEIREANDDIPGEEISRKLYRLEDVLKKIFLVLEKDPSQLPKLRKFMTYYMPTTRKLVQTYRELDAHPVGGENITKAKAEIEQTLDTINGAYEKLLDSFYEDAVIDIRSDRSVLESMLTQDGLSKNPFEGEKLRREQQ